MRRQLSGILGLAALIWGIVAAPAGAATFVVDRVADQVAVGATDDGQCSANDGDPGRVTCTLRAAVQESNGTQGEDTIVLPNLGSPYAITLPGADDFAGAGDLDLRRPVTIQGGVGMPPTIAGSGADRILHVGPGGTGPGVAIESVRLVGGGGVSAGGGAMVESGAISLNAVTLEQNRADAGADAEGGGLWIGSGGSHSIFASTFNRNVASGVTSASGGGLRVGPGAAISITNSTLSGNDAAAGPTGSGEGGAIWSRGNTSLVHVTIGGNGTAGATAQGGSVFSAGGGIVSFRATIIAGGLGNAGVQNCTAGGGLLSSFGFNLEAEIGGFVGQCGLLTGLGDRQAADAGLTPLADRGGPTETQALFNGSPALDAIPSCAPIATDQRGVTRPGAFACDIGAFERQVAVDPGSKCFGLTPTIVGFADDEKIVGTPGDDVIVAGAGDDKVKGGDGDDAICGAKGKDALRGGPGQDRLHGEDGKDQLHGQAGDDRILGGSGKDLLNGGKGRDTLSGGKGKDKCLGRGSDKLKKCDLGKKK